MNFNKLPRPELIEVIHFLINRSCNTTQEIHNRIEAHLYNHRIEVALKELEAATQEMAITHGTNKWMEAQRRWDKAFNRLNRLEATRKDSHP